MNRWFGVSGSLRIAQGVTQRKQKKQCRTFRPRVDKERADRDRDHEKLDIYFALPKSRPRILNGEPRARQICDNETGRHRSRSETGPQQKENRQSCAETAKGRECEHDAVVANDGGRNRTIAPCRKKNAFPDNGRLVRRMLTMELGCCRHPLGADETHRIRPRLAAQYSTLRLVRSALSIRFPPKRQLEEACKIRCLLCGVADRAAPGAHQETLSRSARRDPK